MADSRPVPATDAPEKQMLCGFMDFHRATLVLKCDELDDASLRARLLPSSTSLLGIVKHLTLVEHQWFTVVFAGGDDGLPLPTHENGWDLDDEPSADIIGRYEEVCASSREVVAPASLDDAADWGYLKDRRPEQTYTLRWILTHMIEETARHNGHADILRELLDGSTGE